MTEQRDFTHWQQLRQAWLDLDLLARDARHMERGEATRDRLIAQHEKALQELVTFGEVKADVAQELQAAFQSTAHHVWRVRAPITCYRTTQPNYWIQGSQDLADQAELLLEMAERSALDEATVARAQAAIEQDVAYVALPYEDQEAIVRLVREATHPRRNYPHLHELELDVRPPSGQAAHILVQLLLGKGSKGGHNVG